MAKKREPRACDICRSRKVRCDLSTRGLPCSNCSRASAVCSSTSAWGKAPTEQSSKNIVPPAHIYTFRVNVPGTHNDANNDAPIVSDQESPDSVYPDATGDLLVQNEAPNSTASPGCLELPGYITPLPKHVDQHTLKFLLHKGALTVPERDVVDELLRAFICYVYPSLPVVDLGSFLDAMISKTGNGISLLLFQAVMLAGAAFADLSVLQRAGFQGYQDAGVVFFERVKLLYELDVESSPLVIIQALLLMTYHHGQPKDMKGRLYWMGIALSIATGISLDRPNHYSENPEDQHFRQRLWSCCITQSHLFSLEARRKVLLQSADTALVTLRADELDEMTLVLALSHYYLLHNSQLNASVLGRLFIQKSKLCIIMGQILESQYELNGLRLIELGEPFMALIPKSKATDVQIIARDEELRRWYMEASSCSEFAFGQDHRRNGPVLSIHSATIEMLYLTVLIMVHCPYTLDEQATDSATGALQEFSRLTLRTSARRITEIGRTISECNWLHLLPSVAVEAFVAASIQHLRDANGNATELDLRDTGSFRLEQTLQMLSTLAGRYRSAKFAFIFIERLRSGELFHQYGYLEDRVYLPRHGGHGFTANNAREMEAISISGASSRPQPNLDSTPTGAVSQGRSPMPHIFQDRNRYLNTSHTQVPNLEGYSESFLSMMGWSRPDRVASE